MTENKKIKVTCPSCKTQYTVSIAFIGKKVTCKRCDTQFEVTAPNEIRQFPIIGKLAVKYNFITQEQLVELLTVQEAKGASGPTSCLEELLLSEGLISTDQMNLLQATKELWEARQHDKKFGIIAVRQGYATEADIEQALKIQTEEFKETKISRVIGDIMVDAKMLSIDERDLILVEQERLESALPSPEKGFSTPKGPDLSMFEEKVQQDQPNQSVQSAGELPVGDELKKKILKSLSDLPSMPQIVSKAQKIMASETASLVDLGKVLESDQAMAARVLKLANSAYYGLSGQVSSIPHASVVLGMETLGQLITLAGTSKLLGRELSGYGLDSGGLWRHSLATAFAAKAIAGRKKPKLANDAFSAGLLHDAGKLVLDRHISEHKAAFMAFLGSNGNSLIEAEKHILGFDHSEIASELCRLWNIPEDQSVAIRYHHDPAGSDGQEMAYILQAADWIAKECSIEAQGDTVLNPPVTQTMEVLGLQDDAIAALIDEVAGSVAKIEEEIH